MGIRKVSLRSLIFISVFFISAQSFAQTTDTVVEGKDYSYLRFSEVSDFYKKYGLSLVSSYSPDLFFEAFTWIGTPYKYAGDSYNGVDCSGFAAAIYDQVYNKKISGGCRDIYTKCVDIDFEQITEGDFVFFNIRGPFSHVGVYIGNNKFVHATVHGGVMVNDLDEPYYKRTFYKVARLLD